MFSKVDFPQPEGPMMAMNSPFITSILTLFNAVVSISSVLNRFVRLTVFIIVVVICTLSSFVGIRKALKVEPAEALGG